MNTRKSTESYIEMRDSRPNQDKSLIGIEVTSEAPLTCYQVWKRAFFFRFLLFFTVAVTLLLIIGSIFMQISIDRLDGKYSNEKNQTTNCTDYVTKLELKLQELERANRELSTNYSITIQALKNTTDALSKSKQENTKLSEENANLVHSNQIKEIGWIATGAVGALAIADDIRLRLQTTEACQHQLYFALPVSAVMNEEYENYITDTGL